MKILLNGAHHEIPAETPLADLLRAHDLLGKRIAVEINEEVIPRSRHATHPICEGDRIEIVRAIGGG